MVIDQFTINIFIYLCVYMILKTGIDHTNIYIFITSSIEEHIASVFILLF